MAKYEEKICGCFDELLTRLDNGMLKGSASANLVDATNFKSENVDCAVRLYERLSLLGNNRIGMSITLLGHRDEVFVSAITFCSHRAADKSINTPGEQSFLQHAIDIFEDYKFEI